MSITQTVEVPADRRLTIEVPCEVPMGPVILSFTPAKSKTKTAKLGGWEGKIAMSTDFNEPMEEFKEYYNHKDSSEQ